MAQAMKVAGSRIGFLAHLVGLYADYCCNPDSSASVCFAGETPVLPAFLIGSRLPQETR